mmetsp:Transcript_149817/g.480085  ORF Transcript_149817/g.480085 Transcript_149817/m.480085 type:complete len:209 (-) Transcript_149817:1248-1874(-)
MLPPLRLAAVQQPYRADATVALRYEGGAYIALAEHVQVPSRHDSPADNGPDQLQTCWFEFLFFRSRRLRNRSPLWHMLPLTQCIDHSLHAKAVRLLHDDPLLLLSFLGCTSDICILGVRGAILLRHTHLRWQFVSRDALERSRSCPHCTLEQSLRCGANIMVVRGRLLRRETFTNGLADSGHGRRLTTMCALGIRRILTDTLQCLIDG